LLNKKTKRLFFALWPDDKIRQRISQVFISSAQYKKDGRPFKTQNLHLTLHFLGDVSLEKYECMLAAAESVEFESFDLRLDYFDFFKKPRVFWMGASEVPTELLQLYNRLGEQLSICEYQIEARAFTPHVTLMRKINRFDIQDKPQPVNWHVSQFALVESLPVRGGVVYKPVKFYS